MRILARKLDIEVGIPRLPVARIQLVRRLLMPSVPVRIDSTRLRIFPANHDTPAESISTVRTGAEAIPYPFPWHPATSTIVMRETAPVNTKGHDLGTMPDPAAMASGLSFSFQAIDCNNTVRI